MYPKYAKEMEEAMNPQLIEQRKKMLEQKERSYSAFYKISVFYLVERKKSVKLPIKLPMKGYYESCGASSECSGDFKNRIACNLQEMV